MRVEKNNRDNNEDELVVVRRDWEFLKEDNPNLLKDPISKVQEFVLKLPFLSQEQKKIFIELLRSKRGGDSNPNSGV
jgi:hypothetical protein